MKYILLLLGAASLGLTACQNRPSHGRQQFDEQTRRKYNPETGSFEQSPPYGKQSNKPIDQ